MTHSNDSQPRVGPSCLLVRKRLPPALSVHIALVWTLCAASLMCGCGGKVNRNVTLVKRTGKPCYFSPAAVVVQGDLAYSADHKDLLILDVSDPLNPQCVASLVPEPTLGEKRTVLDVVIDGDYAYLAANGLVVVDISDPYNPRELRSYDMDTRAYDVKVKEDHIYLAGLDNGLLIFDLSDPSQPELVSQVAVSDRGPAGWTPDGVRAVDFVEDYAYVVREEDWTQFVEILDISDPTSPRSANRYAPEPRHGPLDVVVQGQYAFFNGLFYSIDIVEVSDPLDPQLVGSVETPGHVRQYIIDGHHVYVADSFNISVIDVSNPEKPKVVGFYDISGVDSVTRVADYLYAVGQTEGRSPELHIFQFKP